MISLFRKKNCDYSDQQYLDGLRSEDEKIMECLLEKILEAAMQILGSRNKNDERAIDYSKFAFMKIFTRAKEDRLAPGNLIGFAAEIIRNLRNRDYNKEKKHSFTEFKDEQVKELIEWSNFEESMKHKKEIEYMMQCLEEWSNSICKSLLWGFYIDEIPLNDLCHQLGYTYDYIRQKKKPCMEAFRKFVEVKKGMID